MRARQHVASCFRVLASLGIVLHLCAIVLSPNRASILVTPLKAGQIPFYRSDMAEQSWVDRYLAPLGLLSTFAYFAPDPGPGPLYLDYEIQSNLGDEITRGSFPADPRPYFLADRHNRRMTIAYFMVSHEGLAEQMLVPWLCRQYPDADRVRLYRRMHKLPSAYEVSTGQKPFRAVNDFERTWISSTFCGGATK